MAGGGFQPFSKLMLFCNQKPQANRMKALSKGKGEEKMSFVVG